MRRILAGLETEYGFSVSGRGAEDQIDDAMALVRCTPDGRFSGWDYRFESPRSDLRGFQVDRLTVDPDDAAFDAGKVRPSDQDVRSDQILSNGARFYNDHGHPEYSTPECWGLDELGLHDRAGEQVVLAAARRFAEAVDRKVRVYKNNTDFHGASYGTHESYLVPRDIGFDRLCAAVLPMLVARQVLTGAGKVGSERGPWCDFQISQRADFFMESVNIETLHNRPIFNTRDEAHADPAKWIRLHVIAGDACMMAAATKRKVGLIKLAIHLLESGNAPTWRLVAPVSSFQQVSRDVAGEGRTELEGGSWTTPRAVLESYLDAGERHLDADLDMLQLIDECRALLQARSAEPETFRRSVDWAAKQWLVGEFLAAEGASWRDPQAQALDLAYHDVDPTTSLFSGLVDSGLVDGEPAAADVAFRRHHVCEPNRAFVRSIALREFPESVVRVSWRVLTLKTETGIHHLDLDPDRLYPEALDDVETVEEFIRLVEE